LEKHVGVVVGGPTEVEVGKRGSLRAPKNDQRPFWGTTKATIEEEGMSIRKRDRVKENDSRGKLKGTYTAEAESGGREITMRSRNLKRGRREGPGPTLGG